MTTKKIFKAEKVAERKAVKRRRTAAPPRPKLTIGSNWSTAAIVPLSLDAADVCSSRADLGQRAHVLPVESWVTQEQKRGTGRPILE